MDCCTRASPVPWPQASLYLHGSREAIEKICYLGAFLGDAYHKRNGLALVIEPHELSQRSGWGGGGVGFAWACVYVTYTMYVV